MHTYLLANAHFDYLSGAVLMFTDRGGARAFDLWAVEGLRIESNRIDAVPPPPSESPSITVQCTDVYVRRKADGEAYQIPALSFVVNLPVAASEQTELILETGHASLLQIELRDAAWTDGRVRLLSPGPPSLSLEALADRQGRVRFLVAPGWYSLIVGSRPRPIFQVSGEEAEVALVLEE